MLRRTSNKLGILPEDRCPPGRWNEIGAHTRQKVPVLRPLRDVLPPSDLPLPLHSLSRKRGGNGLPGSRRRLAAEGDSSGNVRTGVHHGV